MHGYTCNEGAILRRPAAMAEEIEAPGYQLCDFPGPASTSIDNPGVSAYISAPRVRRTHLAQVAELVDALVSGTSGAIRGGSSPLLGTNSSYARLFLTRRTVRPAG